jgi:hypothetical protein
VKDNLNEAFRIQHTRNILNEEKLPDFECLQSVCGSRKGKILL